MVACQMLKASEGMEGSSKAVNVNLGGTISLFRSPVMQFCG